MLNPKIIKSTFVTKSTKQETLASKSERHHLRARKIKAMPRFTTKTSKKTHTHDAVVLVVLSEPEVWTQIDVHPVSTPDPRSDSAVLGRRLRSGIVLEDSLALG